MYTLHIFKGKFLTEASCPLFTACWCWVKSKEATGDSLHTEIWLKHRGRRHQQGRHWEKQKTGTRGRERDREFKSGRDRFRHMRGSSALLSEELLSQKVVIGVWRAAAEQTPRQHSSNSILGHHYTPIQRHLQTQWAKMSIEGLPKKHKGAC